MSDNEQKCRDCRHWVPHYEGADVGDCEVPLPYWVSLGSPDLRGWCGHDCSAFTPKPTESLVKDQILHMADRVRTLLYRSRHQSEAYHQGVADGLQQALAALNGKE